MKKEMKEKLISFLERAQEIIISEGEIKFSEIKKKSRKEIAKIFRETFAGDYTVECGTYFIRAGLDMKNRADWYSIDIGFYSNNVPLLGYIEEPNDMDINICIENRLDISDIGLAIEFVKRIVPEESFPLVLLSEIVLEDSGEYKIKDISKAVARELLLENIDNLDSAICDAQTADAMSTFYGMAIPAICMMRKQCHLNIGQRALALKLNASLPDGTRLASDDLNEIGYKFQLVTRLA